MTQRFAALLKRLEPPLKNTSVKDLAVKDSTFTWFDLAIAVGIVADFTLSLLDMASHWWYIGLLEVFLALYLLALLLFKSIRPLLARLLLASFIAGICELFTDVSGQYIVHSLVYPVGEPMLWTSPLYMPLSWMVILTHLGYVAWRLTAVLGRWKAALISGIWGAIQIPLYEEMAYYAGWWRYRPTHLMIGHTPIYVLLFEGLVVALLAFLYDRLERRSWSQVAVIGLLLGIWMPIAALVAWLLLGL